MPFIDTSARPRSRSAIRMKYGSCEYFASSVHARFAAQVHSELSVALQPVLPEGETLPVGVMASMLGSP